MYLSIELYNVSKDSNCLTVHILMVIWLYNSTYREICTANHNLDMDNHKDMDNHNLDMDKLHMDNRNKDMASQCTVNQATGNHHKQGVQMK